MAEFKGTITEIGQTQTIQSKTPGKRPFVKRSIVVKEDGDGKWENVVEFTATGDRTEDIDRWSVGDQVTIAYFLNGRVWKDREGRVRHFLEARIGEIKANGFVRKGNAPEAKGPDEPAGIDDTDQDGFPF